MDRTILVADDEPHILHIVSMKLKNAGYNVLTAMDGEEALELCASEVPDLVITDLQMPIMSGLDLCKAMRASDETKGIPAILLTARGFDLEPAEMAEAGIAVVLAKPFSPREVLEHVKRVLDSNQPGAASN